MAEVAAAYPEARPPTAITSNTRHDDRNIGAFFSNAQRFTVLGGTFTNNVTVIQPQSSDAFRKIPMGDVNLKTVLSVTNSASGHVQRRSGWGAVRVARRMYGADVYDHGCRHRMVVAAYDGRNSRENWEVSIAQYQMLRHPSVLQLFGIVEDANFYAAIFHDDLISPTQMLASRADSAVWFIYFQQFLKEEFKNAARYISATRQGETVTSDMCTLWIRPVTGRICVELTPGERVLRPSVHVQWHPGDHRPEITHALLVDTPEIVGRLSFDDYLNACCEPWSRKCATGSYAFLFACQSWCGRESPLHLGLRHREALPRNPKFKLRAVYRSSGVHRGILDREDVAFVPPCLLEEHGPWLPFLPSSSTTVSGWTRIRSDHVQPTGYSCRWQLHEKGRISWLAQAHDIFTRLSIRSEQWDDYVFVDNIEYQLELGQLTRGPTNVHLFSPHIDLPLGFLFLCPASDFRSRRDHFTYPGTAAYWSLDPSGAERLTVREAKALGFPSLKLDMLVSGRRWDGSTYSALREFYEGKGFNAYSLDVARHLRLPHFRIWGLETLFAHSVDPVEDNLNLLEVEKSMLLENFLPDPERANDVSGVHFYEPADVQPSRSLKVLQILQLVLMVIVCMYHGFGLF